MEYLAGKTYYDPLTQDILEENFKKVSHAQGALKINTVYAVIIKYPSGKEELSYGIILLVDGFFRLYTLNIENYKKMLNSYSITQSINNIFNNQFSLVFTNPIIVNNGFLYDRYTIQDRNKEGLTTYTFYEKNDAAGLNDVIFELDSNTGNNSIATGNNSVSRSRKKISSHSVAEKKPWLRLFSKRSEKLFKAKAPIKAPIKATSRVLRDDNLSRYLGNFLKTGGKTIKKHKTNKKSTKRKRRRRR
jgi:hypothetical protein